MAVFFAALAFAGYWLLFSNFMVYDDEGYVLLSLRNFSLYGGLYDKVYTQYGPFPYLLYDALHRLIGFAFNNTSGRWITLVNWLGTGVACGALVYRQTRSQVWAVATLTGTFTYLWVMINEPVHPGSLITLIVATGTWLGAECWTARQFNRFAAIAGLVAIALILTKINVGLFFGAAVFTWMVINTTNVAAVRILTWLIAIICAVLPFALMHSLFGAPWVRMLGFVFTVGSLTTLLAAKQLPERPIVSHQWRWLIYSFIGGGLLLCLLTIARGTSWAGLIDGVVVAPMKQPGVYFFPIRWRTGTGLAAIISAGLSVCCIRLRWWQSPTFLVSVAGIRVLTGGTFLLSLLGVIPATLAASGLSFAISLAWLFTIPLSKNANAASVRSWVALILVFQCLQAYPVAGSQVNWGTFLCIPLLFLGLHDTATFLGELRPRMTPWGPRIVRAAIVGVSLFSAGRLMRTGWASYQTNQPLRLKGAENLRLTNDLIYPLRIAEENLRLHADVLFSFPGLYSANLWTSLPTPTLANATHWFSLLSAERQQEIIAALANRPNSAVLVERDVLNYLARFGFFPAGPLHDWLINHFDKVSAFGGYEIWLKRGRRIPVFSTARADPSPPGVLESLTFTLPALEAPVARIDLCNIDNPRIPLVSFDAKNSETRTAACGMDGTPAENFRAAPLPAAVDGPTLLTLHFSPLHVSGDFSHLLLVLRGEDGAVLNETLITD